MQSRGGSESRSAILTTGETPPLSSSSVRRPRAQTVEGVSARSGDNTSGSDHDGESSGWLPRTPVRAAAAASVAVSSAQKKATRNDDDGIVISAADSAVLALSHQKPAAAGAAGVVTDSAESLLKLDQERKRKKQQLLEQQQAKATADGDRAGVGEDDGKNAPNAVDDDDNNNDDDNDGDPSNSGGEGPYFEILYPSSRPQFHCLTQPGDVHHDSDAFRAALAATGHLQPGVAKKPGGVFVSQGTTCRHSVVAVEGSDVAFVPLLRAALEQAPDDVLAAALPRCFDTAAAATSSEEGAEPAADVSRRAVAFFREHIISAASPPLFKPASALQHSSQLQNAQQQPNCYVVSLRAGVPNDPTSEQTQRCVLTTCNIIDGEPLLVDPVSVFRAYDDERWVVEPHLQQEHQPVFPPKLSLFDLSSSDYIRKRLVGEICVSTHDSRGPPRPLVELKLWPRATYHHGVGNNVKQTLSAASKNAAAAAATDSAKPRVGYPQRLLELRPCAALNGELEVVAGPYGVPYGTALVYGGTLATPKQSKALAHLLYERKRQQQQQHHHHHQQQQQAATSAAVPKNNKKGAVVNGAAAALPALPQRAPYADVEQFIYSYEVGGHGRVILGNTVARYINHKLNFAPSGNVQFVNLPQSSLAGLYENASAIASSSSSASAASKSKNKRPSADDDDDSDEDGGSAAADDDAADDDDALAAQSDEDDADDEDAAPVRGAKKHKQNAKKQQQATKKAKKTKKSRAFSYVVPGGKDEDGNKRPGETCIPFFLVARDVAPGEPLLADSYGSSYDAEMERFISTSAAPLSAADVAAVLETRRRRAIKLIADGTNNNNSSSSGASSALPTITCGYDACYRTGVERGSIVARVVGDGRDVHVYYVHAACWGDTRQPRQRIGPNDPALLLDETYMPLTAEEADALDQGGDADGGDGGGDDDLFGGGLREEDWRIGRGSYRRGGGQPLHAARLRKYFARSAQSAMDHEEAELAKMQKAQRQQQHSAVPASIAVSALRACPFTPRFLVAERLVERTHFTAAGRAELERLTEGYEGGDVRVFYRAASPGKLHAKTPESAAAVSAATVLLAGGGGGGGGNSPPLSPTAAATASTALTPQQQQLMAASLCLLDASSCILVLPNRDGTWPVTFNKKELGSANNNNIGSGGSAFNGGSAASLSEIESVVLTAGQQFMHNALAVQSVATPHLAPHDVALFSHLRLLEPKVKK